MRFRSRSVSAWLGVVALTATAWAEAQIDTRVEIDPAIECWYHDAHPSLDAAVDPSGDIARTRLYFRCMDYADYYFVDLTPSGDDFARWRPRPRSPAPESPTTSRSSAPTSRARERPSARRT